MLAFSRCSTQNLKKNVILFYEAVKISNDTGSYSVVKLSRQKNFALLNYQKINSVFYDVVKM